MGYSSKVGSFNIDTSKTVGQTQAITGLGFQPKIVLFWWAGGTATGDEVAGGNVNIGIGAATSDSNRYAALAFMEDAQATADTYRSLRNDCCILGYTDAASGGLDGVADFASLDADGFTLTIDDQFSLALRISYLALGGTDLTNVYVGDGVMPTSAGNYNETGVGFQPDALLIVSNARTLFTTSTGSNLSLGMATGSSNQGVVSIFSFDNVVTSDTTAYGYNGEIDATATTGAVSGREAFVLFGADGFTLNHLEGSTAIRYFYICLKGGQYSVGDIVTKTDGTDIAETVGFQPVALLFASTNRALDTQDTETDHARLSIGAATSATNRAVQAISDEDNLADTETAFANYDTAVYAHVVDDAIAGLMDIKSIDASGFTAVMDDADPSANWVTYLAIGAAAAAGATIDPAVGSYSVTGVQPTLQRSYQLEAAAGSYALTGVDPALQKGYQLDAEAGAYALTGADPALDRTYQLDASTGTYVLTGVDPALETAIQLEAQAGSYSLAGADPTFQRTYQLDAASGSHVITGVDAALQVGYQIDATAGSYVLTGVDPVLQVGYQLGTEAGAYALTGADPALDRTYQLDAASGSHVITGVDAALQVGYQIDATAGSYVLTGVDPVLQVGYQLGTEAGAYALTGADPALDRTYQLDATAGSYTLTGIDPILTYQPVGSYSLAASAGSYAVTGVEPTLQVTYQIPATAGSYALTGADPALQVGYQLGATAGSYALTGADPTLQRTYQLDTIAGSYAVTGADPTLLRGYELGAVAGVYALTGIDATLTALEMAYARPASDAYIGEWTDQDGGTTNLFEAVNDLVPSDTDYVRSPTAPSNSPVVFGLGSLGDPGVNTSHVLSYRYGKSPEGAGQTLSLTVQLREGYASEGSPGTLIAEWTHSNVSTLATASQILTELQAGAITDYSALFVRMVAEEV